MGFILSSLSLSPYLPVYSTLLVSRVTVLASLIFPIIHREHLARNQALAPVTVDHASGL